MEALKNKIYIVKAMAIFSVICAHCNAVPQGSSLYVISSSYLLHNLGTVGVIIFFIISGLLFHPDAWQSRDYKINKFKRICIPWIISAMCVYLYVHLRKPPLSFWGWLNFTLGNGSYLYYLAILVMLYALFNISVMRKDYILYSCMGMTLVSLIFLYDIMPNPYLNLFNWIGYFALGFMLQKSEKVYLLCHLNRIKWAAIVAYALLLTVMISYGNSGSYWSGINPIVSCIGVLACFAFSFSANEHDDGKVAKLLIIIGKYSFAIYLWHMPLAGLMTKLFPAYVVLRPFMVLVAIIAAGYFVTKIFHLIGKQNLLRYLGIN